MSYPVIQGHEGVCVVAAVGPGVAGVNKGDKVNVQIQNSCGECYACKSGHQNVCTDLKGLGIKWNGLFREYFLCPAANINKVPADFPNDRAMLIEPCSVGVHSAKIGLVKKGERVVVIGAGIIGNFTAQACAAYGAEALIADIVDAKLAIAEKNGVKHSVNTKKESLPDAVGRVFGGREIHAVFDCAGVEASINQAIAVASNASRIVIVANFKEPVLLDIPLFQRREIAIYTVMASTRPDTEEAIRLLAAGKINDRDLISARFPLRRLRDAYQYIDDNPATCVKVAVEM
jgi:L-iditol 2-dehydrogenase